MIIKQNEKKLSSKFYYPSCRNNNCDGILKIKINKNNFSLNYVCEKNNSHKERNVYFQTFQRYYFKEKVNNTCSNCSSYLDNYIKYKCSICDKYYCSSCLSSDIHIKQDINNLSIISSACPSHNSNYIYFCFVCKKYLCNFCIKDNSKKHKNHLKKNLNEIMPNNSQIEKLKNKIGKYDDLINNINGWLKELNKKIEILKKKIIDEKELFQKLILNYDQRFMNYSYYSNFHELYKYSENFTNEYLDKFVKCFTFEQKTKVLFEYLFKREKEPEIITDVKLKIIKNIGEGIVKQIIDNYFLIYSKLDNQIKIMKYTKLNDGIITLNQLFFPQNIENIFIYNNTNKIYTIYVCFKNISKISIFNYNIKSNNFGMSTDEIIKHSSSNFYKCIKLSEKMIATIDKDRFIDIWLKDKENEKGLTHMSNIRSDKTISDIILVNLEYFITSHYTSEQINFYDTNTFSLVKTLSNIDCLNELDSLFIFNNKYILVNCINGFAIIYIKTKELVQYIENFLSDYEKKEIFLSSNKNISIMYVDENDEINESNESDDSDDSEKSEKSENKAKIMNIFNLKFIDFGFQIISKYENIKGKDGLHLMNINNNKIFLLGDNIFLLKKMNK